MNDAVEVATARLEEAFRTGRGVAPVRDVLGGDLDAAYCTQARLVGGWEVLGRRRSGRKIGLTNPRVQAQLGVDRPDFGVLLSDMAVADGAPVDLGALVAPRVEAEVAIVLAADLDRPGPIDRHHVAAATAHAVAALEIVDSRIEGWDISIVDTIADNASCGAYVLGADRVPLDRVAPAEVMMTLRREGEVVSSGSGADCLGDPLVAAAWLATAVRDLGAPLRAGEVVLTGALGPMVPLTPGTYLAEITGLGAVACTAVAAGDGGRTGSPGASAAGTRAVALPGGRA